MLSRTALLALVAITLSVLLTLSAFWTPMKVSPQGCRMSRMWPSYILQTGLNGSWTSPPGLARRYRLMLYREVGWDPNDELRGVPVLFVPGNAGSGHQVRSIASSATMQYYSSPSYMNPYFTSRGLKPLDVFAVDFNEDLSAFHGSTLQSEMSYTASAILYILSLYPEGTKIILMGHSMGGIVSVPLLASPSIAGKISAIITMSTPHGVPPARFDPWMYSIYQAATERVQHDSTPILSICGGITDTMIPSEYCSLPETYGGVYRKTVFTSALEGCWSGVGHREMVWCHQVRWRVARAALELGGAHTIDEKARILDTWFRDGFNLPALPEAAEEGDVSLHDAAYEMVPGGHPLKIIGKTGRKDYKLPVSSGMASGSMLDFVLYLSGGAISPISPASPLPLKAFINICRRKEGEETASCEKLSPSSHKLIPMLRPGQPFPVPDEGADESDGVVAFSAPIPKAKAESVEEWISVTVENEGAFGWTVASLQAKRRYSMDASTVALLLGSINVKINPDNLLSHIAFPKLLSNVLLIYRVVPRLSGSCAEPLLPPLLLHITGPSEAHYHRLQDSVPILLHGHASAPFLPTPGHLHSLYNRGINLTIYSSGECGVEELSMTIDWWNSFGRWGARYWSAISTWGAGVVAILFSLSWMKWDTGLPMPTVDQVLKIMSSHLGKVAALSFAISLLPLPSSIWLGNVGEPFLAPLAPFLLAVASGLVCTSWIILTISMKVYKSVWSFFLRTLKLSSDSNDGQLSRRGMIATTLSMSALVFLLVPWQVAFLACFLLQFHHCATLPSAPGKIDHEDAQNQRRLILLMMTWCLPVVAPVLAVWVRTLLTAGYTTPFDGDHIVTNALGFLVLTYVNVSTSGPITRQRHSREIIPVPYAFVLGALVTFLFGPRSTYLMYEAFLYPMSWLVCLRVLPPLWSTSTTKREPAAAVSPAGEMELDDRNT